MVARKDRAMRGRKNATGAAAVAAASSDEDSDGAPEEVTFESARAAAEETRRLAGERARREKAILKEKRRRREELFKEQKKRKLLPENILEELASSIHNTEDQPSNRPVQDQNVEDESESENEMEECANEEEILATRLQESYTAVRLNDQGFISKQQKRAKDFVRKHLYGKGNNRTTANRYFSVENKRGAVKKAAVQFVNRSWGTMRKQKARQFTKRWMSSKSKTT